METKQQSRRTFDSSFVFSFVRKNTVNPKFSHLWITNKRTLSNDSCTTAAMQRLEILNNSTIGPEQFLKDATPTTPDFEKNDRLPSAYPTTRRSLLQLGRGIKKTMAVGTTRGGSEIKTNILQLNGCCKHWSSVMWIVDFELFLIGNVKMLVSFPTQPHDASYFDFWIAANENLCFLGCFPYLQQ